MFSSLLVCPPMAMATRPLFAPLSADEAFQSVSLPHRSLPPFTTGLIYQLQCTYGRTSPSPPLCVSHRWRRLCSNASSDDCNRVSGYEDMDDVPAASRALEQGEKIRALQKEILHQIVARQNLVSSLKENLGHVSEQMKAHDDRLKDYEKPIKRISITENNPVSVSATDVSEDKEFSAAQAQEPDECIKLSNQNSDVKAWSLSGITVPISRILGSVNADYSYNMSEEPSIPAAGLNMMNVIIVAAECAPWSKTGGLGDVVAALPKALARRGHRVMVIAPRYGQYAEAKNTEVRKRYNVAGQDHEVCYFHGYIEGVDHVFVDNNVFHGVANDIYGGKWEDVLKRMVLLCKAAIEVPWHVPCGGICYGDGNLVFIANDWHTALLPVYLQAYYHDNGLMQYTRSVLVIHNIAHQGRGPMSDFVLLGLPDHYMEKFRLYDPVGGEHMNIFMAGVITSHRIVAVSHGYAWECQTQEGGWGLDSIMRSHNWKLRGVVNGIDDKEWAPELDVYLKSDGYVNYSIDTLERGKNTCKTALQKELGLPVRSDIPILAFIGRLDHQKGVDIIADAMHWIRYQDVQLILLGTGRSDLEMMLRGFEDQNRYKIRAWVGFSVKMAHRITAGSDILLMPSRFEPCGLNQLYAMRYGTIPVVHAVGGLRDTVQSFDPYANAGTGWTFENADPNAMIHALGNAVWTYRDFKDSWKALQRRGMSQDLSWDNAAKQYEEVLIAAKYQW